MPIFANMFDPNARFKSSTDALKVARKTRDELRKEFYFDENSLAASPVSFAGDRCTAYYNQSTDRWEVCHHTTVDKIDTSAEDFGLSQLRELWAGMSQIERYKALSMILEEARVQACDAAASRNDDHQRDE